MRIIFMGSAQLSCASLTALLGSPDFQVIGVVTQPDKPKGRDLKIQPSAVKQLALKHNSPILQPERARNPDFVDQLRALQPELIAVAAYGQILPPSILELPRFGCINVHTSLLPKYRGAAPIQWAILNDEPQTGVTIMKMDAGLDTGDILTRQSTPIEPQDTAETLHDRLAEMGAQLLVKTIPDYITGKCQPRPQPAQGASYAPKIKKEDGLLDWTQPARALWNQVRGLVPWPGAFTYANTSAKRLLLKVWEAEVAPQTGVPGQILQANASGLVVGCGQGALRLLILQPESGRRMSAQQFLVGHQGLTQLG